jgi:hypothetical protein
MRAVLRAIIATVLLVGASARATELARRVTTDGAGGLHKEYDDFVVLDVQRVVVGPAVLLHPPFAGGVVEDAIRLLAALAPADVLAVHCLLGVAEDEVVADTSAMVPPFCSEPRPAWFVLVNGDLVFVSASQSPPWSVAPGWMMSGHLFLS